MILYIKCSTDLFLGLFSGWRTDKGLKGDSGMERNKSILPGGLRVPVMLHQLFGGTLKSMNIMESTQSIANMKTRYQANQWI